MNRTMSIVLQRSIEDCCKSMNNKPGPADTVRVSRVSPLSDCSAAVVFEWESGRKAAFYFYYVDIQGGRWWHFIPKDGHILGLQGFLAIKQQILEENFLSNSIPD